jgi:hypothetical protein
LSVRTHAAAVLFGVLCALSLQGGAQSDAETMLRQVPIDDMQGLRNYLEIKAGDFQQYAKRMQDRIEKLESRIDELESDEGPAVVTAPFVVNDSNGNQIFRVGLSANDGLPRAIVGNPSGANVEFGVGRFGSVVALRNNEFVRSIDITAGDGASYIEIRDKAHVSVVGTDSRDTGSGVFVRKAGTPDVATSLALDKQGGGIVKAFNGSGRPVAALFSDAEGGRLIVANAADGKTMASVAVDAAGGAFNVFPVGGGRSRAALSVDGVGGALSLYDGGGTEIRARLTTNGANGTGLLELGNVKGDIVVSAGATAANSIGFVSTGPFDGGIAGVMGAGHSAASTIMGKATAGKK